MSVDEHTRHQIHGRFEELLGPELAAAFMSYLPPVGWADVATKRDLDHLAAATKRDLDHGISGLRAELRAELAELRTEFHREIGAQTRQLVVWQLGSLMTMAAVAFTAARIA